MFLKITQLLVVLDNQVLWYLEYFFFIISFIVGCSWRTESLIFHSDKNLNIDSALFVSNKYTFRDSKFCHLKVGLAGTLTLTRQTKFLQAVGLTITNFVADMYLLFSNTMLLTRRLRSL